MKNRIAIYRRNVQRILLVLFLPLLFNSCAALLGGMMGDLGGSQPPPPDFEFQYETTGEISFIILQMNDVYEIAPLEKGKVGGMARVATLRNQLMEENFNVLTILAGDFLSPSLIGTLRYEDQPIKGRQMVEVMNGLGVNVVAFGNHEFDIKEKELQQRMDESYFDWIGTNVLHKSGNKIEPFYKESYGVKYFSPETYVWEVTDYSSGQTIKVGFYSATINSNPVPWVYYEDPYQEATKAFLSLKNEADIIVGLTHLSIEEDLKMAALLPESALIMGGHEHANSIDTVGNVVITKADANAKTVYVHRFTYDIATKKTSVYSELVPITDAIPEDEYLKGVVEKWQNVQDEKISEVVEFPDEVIYYAEDPLDGREVSVRTEQTNLAGLIAAGMAASLKKPADCAVFNGGSIRLDDQLTGEITPVDLFRAMPFGGAIFEIDIKGKVLKRVLEAGLENYGSGGYLQWHNIEYEEANKSWKIKGQPLLDNKTYHIASSDYVASGREERLEFFNEKNFVKLDKPIKGDTTDLREDVRRAVVNYLKGLKK